jgi:mono/diheme cytochrome c family protein
MTSNQQAGTGGTFGGAAGTSPGVGGVSAGGSANSSQGGGAGSNASGGLGSRAGGGGGAGLGAGGAAGSGMGLAGGGPVSNAPADVFEYYCSGCHEAKGVGGKYAPEIQHPVRDYSSWVVRNGLPGVNFRDPMEAIPANVISDAVLETIWDWLDEPAQPTTGEGLYLDYCANCHGADGKGGITMRPITNELPNLKKEVRSGSHLGQFDQRREYMSAFPTSVLTDAELTLIYNYVDSL